MTRTTFRRARHVACLLALGALACTLKPSVPKVIGRYVLDRPAGSDTLQILPGGRYVHVTVFNGHRFMADSGAWRFTHIDGHDRLQLEHWVFWNSPSQDSLMLAAAAGSWYPPQSTLPDGRLSLIVDPAKGWAFVRVP